MKLQTKKIIAREFLLLMFSFGIGLVAFSCTYLYNFYHHTKSQNISSEIENKEFIADSLAKPLDNKTKQQVWFYNKNIEMGDSSASWTYGSPEKLWHRMDELALQDSIIIKYQKVWTPELKELLSNLGFKSPNKLQDFIDKNRITSEDNSNFEKAKNIRPEINSLKSNLANHNYKVLFFKSQIEFGFWAFCISLLIFFAMRYIFYSIKWSIKTLKQK